MRSGRSACHSSIASRCSVRSVGVNDVARGEEAGCRALEIAPGPVWEGGALAGLGQAQYLRGDIAEARSDAPQERWH